MKKLIIVLMFCIILISCKGTDTNEADSNIKPLTELPEESVKNMGDTGDTSDNAFSIMDLTEMQLESIQLELRDGERLLFSGSLEASIRLSDYEAAVSDYGYKTLRNSSQALYCDGIDSEYGTGAIDAAIASMEYLYSKNDDMVNESFKTGYELSADDMVLSLDYPGPDISSIRIKEIKYGYSVDSLTLYGFIRRDQNAFKVIIDPAYMKGLPVYHSSSELCKYEINGIDIEADTLSMTVTEIDESIKGDLDSLGTDYVYARLQLNNFNCSYKTMSGYNSTAELCGFTSISGDTAEILSRKFNIDSSNKSSEITAAFNALISNKDVLNSDSVVGVSLLDLDFDGTPEVMVSKCPDNWEQMKNEDGIETIDVDVYRINGDSLVYIDTLRNYHTVIYEVGNRLGIKKSDDGSKAWFNMSYIDRDSGEISDTDYLFNLEGNELVFTEVFSKDREGNYYYYGEPMVFEEELFVNEYSKEESMIS